MEKLRMKTNNKIQENIDYISKKFPSAIVETKDENNIIIKKIDFEILKQELSNEIINDKQERYQMTWPDKRKHILLANTSSTFTLRPVKEKSVNFNSTNNIYIEGDNLDVLKLLRETYLNKVKMIYIDPPYNTGNDFVYEDDYAQPTSEYLSNSGQYDSQGNRLFINSYTNGRFHTDWLNMMYPRLKVAKDFLTDDGVIFISIDDNELKNLLKICDEIFGEKNFVGIFTVENNPKGRKNSKFISVSCEYCLVYCKNIDMAFFVESVPKNAADLSEDEDGNLVHNSGKRVLVGENNFNKFVTDFDNNKHYTVYYNRENKDMIIKNENQINDYNNDLKQKGYSRYYSYRDGKFVENTYTKEKLNELYKQKLLDFKEDKIYEKNTSTTIRIKSLLINREYDGVYKGQKIRKVYDFKTTSAGTAFKELFKTDKVFFTAPKNVNFISTLMELLSLDDSIILDFFSGSATTAHAVMKLNAEDQGNRRFIMVQLPEKCVENSDAYNAGYKTICDIGEERIRRAGNKIKEEAGLLGDNLDIGFRVFKLDSSNMNDVFYNPNATTQTLLDTTIDNIKSDRTPLDLLFQVMLELGIELSAQIEEKETQGMRYYVVNENDIVACFENNISNIFITELAKIKPLYVVLKESSFIDDAAYVSCYQILKTYNPHFEEKYLKIL